MHNIFLSDNVTS